MHRQDPHHAFSLVELSIVLVILGLLVGGILAGQSLIHASEMRAVTAEAQRYTTAVMTFRDKYFGLPGDITNATSIWGTDPGGCPAATNTVTKQETCNGNGDMNISSTEGFRAWQQLADAGIIEGQYTGVAGVSSYDGLPGINVPASKFTNAYWTTRSLSVPVGYTGAQKRFVGEYPPHWQIGTRHASTGWNDDPAFKPEDSWNIDVKMDDGLPGRGRVIAYVVGCTGSTDLQDYDAVYAVDNTAAACIMHFMYGGNFSH